MILRAADERSGLVVHAAIGGRGHDGLLALLLLLRSMARETSQAVEVSLYAFCQTGELASSRCGQRRAEAQWRESVVVLRPWVVGGCQRRQMVLRDRYQDDA